MRWLGLLFLLASCGPTEQRVHQAREQCSVKKLLPAGERLMHAYGDARTDYVLTTQLPEREPATYKVHSLHNDYCIEVVEQ